MKVLIVAVTLLVAVSGQSGNFISIKGPSFTLPGGSRTSSFAPSSSSTFSRSSSSSFAQGSRNSFNQVSSGGAPPNVANPENICQLKNFAEDRCSSRTTNCKKCIVDTVQRRCPYDSRAGPPDCNKLQSCAKSLSFNC